MYIYIYMYIHIPEAKVELVGAEGAREDGEEVGEDLRLPPGGRISTIIGSMCLY